VTLDTSFVRRISQTTGELLGHDRVETVKNKRLISAEIVDRE